MPIHEHAQQAEVPWPDVLLLDLTLPGQHGTALLQRWRALPRCAALMVIIVTASNASTERIHTLALGATAFVQQPTSFDASME
jgi:two-component system, response regulator